MTARRADGATLWTFGGSTFPSGSEARRGVRPLRDGDTRVVWRGDARGAGSPFLRGCGQGWSPRSTRCFRAPNETPRRRERTDGESWGRTHEIQRLVGRSLRAVVDFEALGERTGDDRLRRPAGGRGDAHRLRQRGVDRPVAGVPEAGLQGGDTRNPVRDHVVAVSVGLWGGGSWWTSTTPRTPRRMST